MYFWKINKLNEQLMAGKLDESEAFKYLMAYTIITALSMIQYSTPNLYDTYGGIIDVVIAILGLLFIYKCNGGRNGKYIIERYLSIGWVVFIRFIVMLLIPLLIIIFTIQEIYMGGVPEEITIVDTFFTISMEIVYILWIGKHVNYVAKNSNV